MDMLGILEVAIGIVLIYLVLSLVCTSLLEALIAAAGLKHKTLRESIERLIGGELTGKLYEQPEIGALHGPKQRQPSYIPPDVFARCVLNLASNGTWRRSGGLPSVLREEIVEFGRKAGDQQRLGDTLCRLLDEAGGDIELFRNKIELWFDRTGDRSKGWFKRRVNAWLLLLGMLVSLAVNADTVMFFQRLSDDPALREAAVQIAVEQAAKDPSQEAKKDLEGLREQLGEVAPFIGWSMSDPVVSAWQDGASHPLRALGLSLLKLVGLLLTAFAISLGAPFWFDLLQKLVNIRKSIAAERTKELAKEEAPEAEAEAEEDGEAAPRAREEKEPAYAGAMAGFSPTAARIHLGNAYWLARAAELAYETDEDKLLATIASWGMTGHVFASKDPQVKVFWKGKFATVDTQGFIAADDHAVIVCFRGTEPTRPADIVTDLKAQPVPADDYGQGKVHDGFKAAVKAVWPDLESKLSELGGKQQVVWFAGHSLGGALAVLAASRYDQIVKRGNGEAKKTIADVELKLEKSPDDATLVGQRQQALARLRGRLGGVYTIGQPRVGDETFVRDFEARVGDRHVRIINNRDVVPRVPLRAMDYDHSGTVLYFDEFGRLHRDPGLWLRLLDTVVISRAEVGKAREGVKDHSSKAYVDLLDKARKSKSALTRLAVA